jgi:hypothetical protein
MFVNPVYMLVRVDDAGSFDGGGKFYTMLDKKSRHILFNRTHEVNYPIYQQDTTFIK